MTINAGNHSLRCRSRGLWRRAVLRGRSAGLRSARFPRQPPAAQVSWFPVPVRSSTYRINLSRSSVHSRSTSSSSRFHSDDPLAPGGELVIAGFLMSHCRVQIIGRCGARWRRGHRRHRIDFVRAPALFPAAGRGACGRQQSFRAPIQDRRGIGRLRERRRNGPGRYSL